MLQPQLELTVRMDNTGRISITGPLENKILCYGLLEAARDAIHAAGDQPKIVPVSGIIQPFKPPGHD
jgi:hypothetical protein